MNGTPQPKQEVRGGLELLGLSALANYAMSGLVKPGEHMHEEIALRLARRVSKRREEDGPAKRPSRADSGT